jgi:lipopolysaccharide transport system permease protein
MANLVDSNTTVYIPNYRTKIGFFQTWIIMIRNIVKSRELIIQLFKRDFLMSYKKSFIGWGWIFVSPIVGIVSWVFMNQAGILEPGEVGVPYPAFVLLSSSIWGLFMGFYGSASATLTAGGGIITQVKYPHEALLVKQTAQHLAGFSITFFVNIGVLLAFGVMPDWKIFLFPLLTLPLFFLGAGMGLIVSVVNVVATDITNILNILLGFVFYVTPVIYATDSLESKFQTVIKLNPLTYLVGGVRDLVVYGEINYWDRFLLVSLLSFIFFMFSWRLFFVSEDKVIEKMI